jgi:hypothetical protein
MMKPEMAQIEEPVRNPERRGVKKGLYLIPSVFTAANIGMGFYAVMAAARGSGSRPCEFISRQRRNGNWLGRAV